MSDKEQTPLQPQQIVTGYYPMYPEPKNDEIDLFELIAQLWKKKWWIVGCMFLTTSIAGIYAFTAKEQWTATAVVDVPGYDTFSNYYQGIRLINESTDRDTTDEVAEKLFKQFVSQASSYNELSKFISQSDYFKSLSEGKSEKETTDLLNEIVDNIKIIKDRDNLIYTINFPANTAEKAKMLLENYIEMVNSNVSNLQYTQLSAQILNKKNRIENQMTALRKIAAEKRQEEIENINMAIVVAEKSNIQKPEVNGLTRLDSTNLFLLGKDALSAMSENISKQPLVLNEAYYDLQRQYINLDNFKVDNKAAQAFSYLKSPITPINRDKPRRSLILVLGACVGIIFGTGLVLVNRAFNNYKTSKSNQ